MNARRADSRTDVQEAAAKLALAKLNEEMQLQLGPDRLRFEDVVVDVDGYQRHGQRVVVAEIWCHVGTAKVAQKHKVLSDLLKLALVSHLIKEKEPASTVEAYLVFVDPEACLFLGGKSWAAAAATLFNVKTKIVELPAETIEQIRQAQKRQDLRAAAAGA